MDAALPLVPARTRAAPFVRVFALALVVGAVLLAALLAFARREQHLALGGEIVHDDFGFRVRDVGVEPSSTGAARTVTVRFEVNNHARRVPFDLATWTPVLVDARGATLEPDTAAEAELARGLGRARLREGNLDAGDSELCTAVFAVPADARGLRFAVSWGLGTVDLLDDLIFGAKDIALGELDGERAR